MTLAEARASIRKAEIGSVIRIRQADRRAGPHFRADRQAGDFQKVREAERETIYREYADRVGELVNTTIKRVEGSRIWWSIWARPKPVCPSASSRASKATAWATACAA
jgi:hypothetical protein